MDLARAVHILTKQFWSHEEVLQNLSSQFFRKIQKKTEMHNLGIFIFGQRLVMDRGLAQLF